MSDYKKQTLETIREAGYSAYMRDQEKDTWCYFTDGTRIGCAADYGQPAWLPEPITHYQLASILEYESMHGHERSHEPLEGGSYMPAIEYDTAERVMRHYGDDVLDYLKAKTGRVPNPQMAKYAWCQLPCFFLSRAVLAFAREYAALADYENESPIDLTRKES